MRAHLSLLLLAALVAAFLGLATVTSAADPKDCEGKQACEEDRSLCSVCVVCFLTLIGRLNQGSVRFLLSRKAAGKGVPHFACAQTIEADECIVPLLGKGGVVQHLSLLNLILSYDPPCWSCAVVPGEPSFCPPSSATSTGKSYLALLIHIDH